MNWSFKSSEITSTYDHGTDLPLITLKNIVKKKRTGNQMSKILLSKRQISDTSGWPVRCGFLKTFYKRWLNRWFVSLWKRTQQSLEESMSSQITHCAVLTFFLTESLDSSPKYCENSIAWFYHEHMMWEGRMWIKWEYKPCIYGPDF